MKWFWNVFYLAGCLFCFQFVFAQKSETGFLNRSVSVDGINYRFQVYLPPNFTPKNKYPVILFLHGSGENGDDGILPTDHGLGTAIRRHSERFPTIVVFPQCRPNAVWFGSMERQSIKAFEQTVKEFNGDLQRFYLTGISLGGYGVWQFAAQHPGKFAAIVPVAGGIVPPRGLTLPAEVEELARAGNQYLSIIRSDDPYTGVARLIGKTPVWVFHGESDKRVPVTEARRMVEALKQTGGNVKYTEYAGEGHGITDQTYAQQELIVWLLSQRLNK